MADVCVQKEAFYGRMICALGVMLFKCAQIIFDLLLVNFNRLRYFSIKVLKENFNAAYIVLNSSRAESFPGNFVPEKFYILRNIHNVIIWLLIILIGCGIYCMLGVMLRQPSENMSDCINIPAISYHFSNLVFTCHAIKVIFRNGL